MGYILCFDLLKQEEERESISHHESRLILVTVPYYFTVECSFMPAYYGVYGRVE